MENKKLNKLAKTLLLISGVLLMLFLTYGSSVRKHKKIEVGQVYKYVENSENPFEDDVVHYNLVLGVQGDFVLYYDSALKDTLSERKSLFLQDSELVK